MTNIWGFLLQTISVSMSAALILLMKRLLADKLSPRWQYGIWLLLVIRILVPASLKKSVLLPYCLLLETSKASVERTLDSAWSEAYMPISVSRGFPVIKEIPKVMPKSITDWLFVIYLAGVLLCLLWFTVSYLRLRLLLRRGEPASTQVLQQISAVSRRYHLKDPEDSEQPNHPGNLSHLKYFKLSERLSHLSSCRVLIIQGLSSAFICGIIHPILVLPAAKETDDKVLLHELLHLKYHDALQNIGWCILRAIHWCNPFLQYIFNRIGNDMESLCDQRVLEHLEGEDRREYGRILLDMANERYARAPGTTSLSNGGKNISRRITAIVRFKKYPQGMALVSICIAIVLFFPAITGTTQTYETSEFHPVYNTELERSLAMSRINRCTTVAGALDTYAKGLLFENGICIATSSPLSRQEELADQMRYNLDVKGRNAYYLESGPWRDYVTTDEGYYIINLNKISDECYKAVLTFSTHPSPDEENPPDQCSILIPVIIRYEDAWVVEETGNPEIIDDVNLRFSDFGDFEIAGTETFIGSGISGTVELKRCRVSSVDNTVSAEDAYQNMLFSITGSTGFNDTVKVDAEFSHATLYSQIRYSIHENDTGQIYPQKNDMQENILETGPKEYVGMIVSNLFDDNEEPVFPDSDTEIVMSGDHGGISSEGYSWKNTGIDENWNGELIDEAGSSYDINEEKEALPQSYAVKIFWDNEPVDTILLKEVAE